jgi:hypothetical protein
MFDGLAYDTLVPPTAIRSTRAPLSGSIRNTVPSPVSAAQIEPAPKGAANEPNLGPEKR